MHTDKDLLHAVAQGDRKATEMLYVTHRKPLIAWIVKRGGSEHDAEDVFHEAMVVLFEKAQQESFRLTCKISTYLFAIGKYIWYKKNQSNARIKIAFTDQMDMEGDEHLAYESDIAAHHERELMYGFMERALVQLGSPCKELLQAFYLEQKSMKEIAEQFRYTNPENAKTQKYKCLNRLKKLYNGQKG